MEGWIKLHRKIEEWEWANNPNTFCLFVHLLLMASYEEKKCRGVDLKSGQVMASLQTLSAKTGLSVKAVRIALNHLIDSESVERYSEKESQETAQNEGQGEGQEKDTQEVTEKAQKGANCGSVITICNYNSYQSENKDEGHGKGQGKGTKNGKQKGKQKGTIQRNKEEDDKSSSEERNIPPTPQGVEIIKNFGFEISTDKWGFADAVAMWLRHKKGKGQSYKTQDSFDTMVKNLIEMSDGDMQTAQKVVEQAIANNYAGLFPLRPSGSNSGSNTKPRKVSPLSVAKKMLGYNEPQNQKTEDVTWTEV